MLLHDRFELGAVLGRGTFGTTYAATDLHTGQRVACKHLVLAGLPGWKPVELFEREARVLASLNHPGIPAFVDAFEHADDHGQPGCYIVTEFVEGPTLATEIQRGRRWTPIQARALFRRLLETLDYLHTLSPRVIHRDIKPGNVILKGGEQAMLVDFGSVKEIAARGADGALTIAGTAGYMAPEQAMGLADPRSDLYGLAATMVHVLTHVSPTDLPRQGMRPSLVGVAGVDPALDVIFERLLDPDPDRRWASAAAVLGVLGRNGGSRAADAPSVAVGAAGEPTAIATTNEPAAARNSAANTAIAVADTGERALLVRLAAGPRPMTTAVGTRLDYGRAAYGVGMMMGTAITGGSLASLAVAGALKLPWLIPVLVPLALATGLWIPWQRRKRDLELYCKGHVERGRIQRVRAGAAAQSLIITYVFVHADHPYRGTLAVSDPLIAKQVDATTPIMVFFDPTDPNRNMGMLPAELAGVFSDDPK